MLHFRRQTKQPLGCRIFFQMREPACNNTPSVVEAPGLARVSATPGAVQRTAPSLGERPFSQMGAWGPLGVFIYGGAGGRTQDCSVVAGVLKTAENTAGPFSARAAGLAWVFQGLCIILTPAEEAATGWGAVGPLGRAEENCWPASLPWLGVPAQRRHVTSAHGSLARVSHTAQGL